ILLFISLRYLSLSYFFLNAPATTQIYTLSLHDALPICLVRSSPSRLVSRCATGDPSISSPSIYAPSSCKVVGAASHSPRRVNRRSEEHTSELQSPCNLVCRLLLEKKKKKR